MKKSSKVRSAMSSWVAGACAVLGLALLGLFLSPYLVSLLTIVFLFAFIGQSWNLMLGLGGQLSVGHALFVGIGAYSVGVLNVKYGLTPWLGLALGMLIAGCVGAVQAWLSLRFEVRGIYFALLTIAAAEFTRVVFSGWDFVGGMQGMFFQAQTGSISLLELRGDSRFFYCVALGAVAVGMAATAVIRNSFLGYVWRAMRDDEAASRALGVRTFLHKMLVISISGAWAAFGGGLLALVQGSIFPDSIMGMHISVEVLIGPIVGGLGTVFGPLIGAAVVIPVNHAMSAIGDLVGIPGLNNITYGIVLIGTVWFLPDGIWPAITNLTRLVLQRLKLRQLQLERV